MRKITVAIPRDSRRRARLWAAQRDTSIHILVRHLLETLPGIARAERAFPSHNLNPVNLIPTKNTPSPA
ncbi:MAG: hypothetical protein ACLQNE_34615 [Thermoguttaceae bacterium]